jgi:hypothetical protein
MRGHTDKTERTSYYFGREIDLKEKLLLFERKILRRILGPTQKANGE